ncbi:TetR/AcrR family transcriptional regulator [Natroniella sp. ANB-PHB2]|uniref:TetR/AcrR family transcriptional regulator n=1 Tax=Natroniella sp. ANB-PHB2 TaxID=3384444 RepID=UPI0038D3C40C
MHPKKERIIKAAIKKFSHQGVSNTTVQEIAKEAGVGKGTIYRYFENKEDLSHSLVELGIKRLTDRIKVRIENLDNPINKLEVIIETKLEFYSQYYDYGKYLIREIWGHKDSFEKHIKKIRELHTVIIEDIIKEGIDQGKFKDLNVETAAVSLIGAVNINVLHWVMFSEEFLIDEIKEDIMEIYFSGLLKP